MRGNKRCEAIRRSSFHEDPTPNEERDARGQRRAHASAMPWARAFPQRVQKQIAVRKIDRFFSKTLDSWIEGLNSKTCSVDHTERNDEVFFLHENCCFLNRYLLKCWVWSGATVCTSCRAWKILSNEYLLAKCGFDTAENEPAKNVQNICKMFANCC